MTLADLCALVAGRVPLVIEVKSHFDGDRRLVKRIAEVPSTYSGPAVGMSFDPDQRDWRYVSLIPGRPAASSRRREYTDEDWQKLTPERRNSPCSICATDCAPNHISWRSGSTSCRRQPWIARNVFGCPLLTWTVRTPEQRACAARHADQMIFEGFVPDS